MEIARKFHAALMDAFTIDDMQKVLKFEMVPSVEIESIVGDGGNKENQFYDVIEWASRNGRLNELAFAAYRFRSGNEKIRVFFESYGQIDFVARGIPPLTMSNNGPYVIDESPSQTLRDRVREIELLLRGFSGTNGLQSEIKELRKQVSDLKDVVDKLAATVAKLESPGPSSSIIWRIIFFTFGILVSIAAVITVLSQFGFINAG